jgi:hypothetical protein
VADVQLLDFGNRRDRRDVARRQAVPRVDGQSERFSMARCVLQRPENGWVVRMVRIAPGVKLDCDGAQVPRARDRVEVRVDEEARPNARRPERFDRGAQSLWIARDIETPFGRDLLASFRNERHLVRPESGGDRDHLARAGHLEVQHRPNCCRQALHVVILDVTAILAQVRGDAIGPGGLAFDRSEYRVGFDGATRLAQRRDVVDVNVKALVHCGPNHHLHARARGESPVKRTILLLLTFAACRSASTPPPSSNASVPANLPGAAAPKQAVERFLAAAKSQDLQEMSIAWGTSKGPARDQFERAELEKRLIVMQGCYDSDKHQVVDEQPGDNGKRVLRVEITRGAVTKTPRFTTVKGPSDRWYVEDADFAAVTALCKR